MKDNLNWPLVILLLCILGAIWAANAKYKPAEANEYKYCWPLIECEEKESGSNG